MKTRTTFCVFLLVFFIFGLFATAQEKPEDDFSATNVVPEKFQSLVEESLELAGENSDQIEEFLRKAPVGQREAASFLIAYMAPSDLAFTTSELLCEHLDYAFKTRDLLPWSKKVTKELFHHYVLPCRVTQEPFEQWRKYLFERIYPRIKHFETMEEVALEINRWCKERFTYKPTQRRDQGIFENLKRGVGRCEEMMILYICAARAVGIPVRACSTPLWSTCNSNHAWVEVWCDGKWYYLGACEPADTLDTAWFTLPAQRAPLVLSKIYGIPENAKNVYRRYKRSAIINTTSVYAETGKVILDAGKDTEVYFYVFNYGSLRPFSKREADTKGRVEVEFGPGEYIFTIADNDKVVKWGKAKVQPGKNALIEYGKEQTPEGRMWLRYPKKPKKRKGKEPEKKERKPLPKYEAPPDIYKVKHFKPEDYPKVMEKIKDHKLKDKVVEALKKSLGNCDNLAQAILEAWDDDLGDLFYLITELPELDLIEATPWTLFEHISYAKLARASWKKFYDKETWRKHVLNPRTGYEPLRVWREKFYIRFQEMTWSSLTRWIGKDPAAAALRINKWISEHVKVLERGYAGSWKDPLSVVISGRGTKSEINGCAIGILRSIGIPAKLSKNKKWVEFFDGKEWQPLYPLEPEHFKSRKKSADVATAYEKPGTLSLTFKRKGSTLVKFQDFAAMKLSGKYWAAKWPDKETDENGTAKMELAPGEYLFNAGVRNRNGDPYIFFKRMKIEPGKEIQLEVVLDMPVEQLSREDLVVRPIKKLPEITTRFISVPEGEQKQSFQLWVFFTLDNEPCKSMLPRINKIADGTHDLLTLYLYLGTDEKLLKQFSGEHHLGGTRKLVGFADPKDSIKKLKLPNKDNKLTAMPSVMLVDSKSRRILYWEEGFNLAIDQTLQQVLELMRSREKNRPKDSSK
jgi:hypothetical protein